MSSSRSQSQSTSVGAAQAVATGWSRVREHWTSVGAAYLLSVLLALPLAGAMQSTLAQSLRHREAADNLLSSWDGLWYASFSAQAQGIAGTFDAGIVGIGAVLRALDGLVTGAMFALPLPLMVAGLCYLLGWTFLSGGLLARFGGDERGLIRLGAQHFGRMLTLAVVGWIAWAVVLAKMLPWLTAWVADHNRDVIDERVHAAWIVGKYLVVWAFMLAIRLIVDYAKVAAIADPECTAMTALQRGMSLCRARTGAIVGVTVRLGVVGLGLMVLYWVVAPSAEQANAFKILIAFGISQTSVIARVTMRAWGLASAQALAAGR
ncbi:MAG: hypothetical protein AAF799_04605 [Myxococcota bacterium]